MSLLHCLRILFLSIFPFLIASHGLTHLAIVAQISGIAVASSVSRVASRLLRTSAVFPAIIPERSFGAFSVAGFAGESRRTQALAGNVIARKTGSAPAGGRARRTKEADRTRWGRGRGRSEKGGKGEEEGEEKVMSDGRGRRGRGERRGGKVRGRGNRREGKEKREGEWKKKGLLDARFARTNGSHDTFLIDASLTALTDLALGARPSGSADASATAAITGSTIFAIASLLAIHSEPTLKRRR